MPPLHSTFTLNPGLQASPRHSYCIITTQYIYHCTLSGHPPRIAGKIVTLRGRHLLGGISQLSSTASLSAALHFPRQTRQHPYLYSHFLHLYVQIVPLATLLVYNQPSMLTQSYIIRPQKYFAPSSSQTKMAAHSENFFYACQSLGECGCAGPGLPLVSSSHVLSSPALIGLVAKPRVTSREPSWAER